MGGFTLDATSSVTALPEQLRSRRKVTGGWKIAKAASWSGGFAEHPELTPGTGSDEVKRGAQSPESRPQLNLVSPTFSVPVLYAHTHTSVGRCFRFLRMLPSTGPEPIGLCCLSYL